MGAEDRKQDVWFVRMVLTTGNIIISEEHGVIDLPRPMTAFDAADYAVRIGVRDVVKGDMVAHGYGVTASIFGRNETSPGMRTHQYTAVAEYDADRDAFMRLEPWRGDGCRAEVKATEGARFEPLDWNQNG
jgi:hypothetical protein